ncbi:amidohydrolase [Patulibacter sp.]|uniref:amidohydrolase family protein n=1 Tax=Patulibacter sp. TaxID=1912859 RepID=UPI0027293769|nr:amidohydrolase family protein [Patulibacter sp.]MDO9409012.1 amidohydrolase family protein [Patulibacter sp.]
MTRPPFTDCHVHLWDRTVPGLDYAWLDPTVDPVMGDVSAIQFERWDATDHLRDSRHAGTGKVVHVQAAGPPGDAVAETAWLEQQHQSHGLPDAIVARADLRAPDLSKTLDRHAAASGLLRGIRDMSSMGHLDDPDVLRGLRELERRDLVWDLACGWSEMPVAADLARACPGLRIALNHAGWPVERTDEYFASWRTALFVLAAEPNVHCKISGLGMADHEWSVASWRPWVQTCLDAFGPERCVLGANWPVDRLFASYDAVVAAFAQLTDTLSPGDQRSLFTDNAARLYRV